uniref:Helicase C-terminal domain-containing protein n=1 Tax=Palpitomonas bilix TaxID=652834 RepID=A0A7S3FZU9_9EUKA
MEDSSKPSLFQLIMSDIVMKHKEAFCQPSKLSMEGASELCVSFRHDLFGRDTVLEMVHYEGMEHDRMSRQQQRERSYLVHALDGKLRYFMSTLLCPSSLQHAATFLTSIVVNVSAGWKMFSSEEKLKDRREGKQPYQMSELPRLLQSLERNELFPSIIFKLQREKIISMVDIVLKSGISYIDRVDEEKQNHIRRVAAELRGGGRERGGEVPMNLVIALERGIAAHFSTLSPIYLKKVEELARVGALSVMFSTSTLAMGMHLPCRSVVFSGVSSYLNPMIFAQCIGRCGRRGLDERGVVIFYDLSMVIVETLLQSKQPAAFGHFPLSISLCLRLHQMEADGKDEKGNRQGAQALLDTAMTLLSNPFCALKLREKRRALLPPTYAPNVHTWSDTYTPLVETETDKGQAKHSGEVQKGAGTGRASMLFLDQVHRERTILFNRCFFQYSSEMLAREGMLSLSCTPMGLAGIASHLYYMEPSNFIFAHLLSTSTLHQCMEERGGMQGRGVSEGGDEDDSFFSYLPSERLLIILCYLIEPMPAREENCAPALPAFVEENILSFENTLSPAFDALVAAYAKTLCLDEEEGLPYSGNIFASFPCEAQQATSKVVDKGANHGEEEEDYDEVETEEEEEGETEEEEEEKVMPSAANMFALLAFQNGDETEGKRRKERKERKPEAFVRGAEEEASEEGENEEEDVKEQEICEGDGAHVRAFSPYLVEALRSSRAETVVRSQFTPFHEKGDFFSSKMERTLCSRDEVDITTSLAPKKVYHKRLNPYIWEFFQTSSFKEAKRHDKEAVKKIESMERALRAIKSSLSHIESRKTDKVVAAVVELAEEFKSRLEAAKADMRRGYLSEVPTSD